MSDICAVTSPSVYVLTKLQRAQYAAEKRKKALNEPTRVSICTCNTVCVCVCVCVCVLTQRSEFTLEAELLVH